MTNQTRLFRFLIVALGALATAGTASVGCGSRNLIGYANGGAGAGGGMGMGAGVAGDRGAGVGGNVSTDGAAGTGEWWGEGLGQAGAFGGTAGTPGTAGTSVVC